MSEQRGSVGDTDADFLTAVEAATWPGERFRHREHLRLAWLCLRAEGFEGGLSRLRGLIRGYAMALGATGKYHETMTRGWAELVQGAMDAAPGSASLDALLEASPELADARLLASHYQKATLDSAEARAGWVAPDLKPLRQGREVR
ncbi:hypothetical protein [Myxococcus eversor]|uniref:hypothetical protein n=1 Tax=Myxococcus eversor TaxID=2709661 RepID=UPI0013D34B66|nr:hypothetical protein [Myxococcus eversor]